MEHGTIGGDFDRVGQIVPDWYKPPSIWINGSEPITNNSFTYSHTVGRKIYYHNDRSMNVYDADTNISTTLLGLQVSSYEATSSIVDKNIYIFSNSKGSSYREIVKYNIESNTYSVVGNNAEDRIGATSSVINNHIYIMCGYKLVNGNEVTFTTNKIFDTNTNISSDFVFASLSDGIGTCSIAINNKIYLWGGKYFTRGEYKKNNKLFIYENGSWTSLSNSHTCSYASSAFKDNYIYSFGDEFEIQDNARFNVLTNIWEPIVQPRMPSSISGIRYGMGLSIIDDFIYVFGGNRKIMEVYIP